MVSEEEEEEEEEVALLYLFICDNAKGREKRK